jgi:hypothetical protein
MTTALSIASAILRAVVIIRSIGWGVGVHMQTAFDIFVKIIVKLKSIRQIFVSIFMLLA